MKQVFLAATVAFLATSALAHSPLEATVPEQDAILDVAPNEIALDFKGKIRLTRVTLTLDSQQATDLDLGAFKGFLSDYAIPVEPMGSGAYEVEWRGLGDDGHPMNGTFSFTVKD
ncbi:MAG: copper resistance protein CopC [Tateyamaria sp.]